MQDITVKRASLIGSDIQIRDFPVALLKGRMYAGNTQHWFQAFDTDLRDNIYKGPPSLRGMQYSLFSARSRLNGGPQYIFDSNHGHDHGGVLIGDN